MKCWAESSSLFKLRLSWLHSLTKYIQLTLQMLNICMILLHYVFFVQWPSLPKERILVSFFDLYFPDPYILSPSLTFCSLQLIPHFPFSVHPSSFLTQWNKFHTNSISLLLLWLHQHPLFQLPRSYLILPPGPNWNSMFVYFLFQHQDSPNSAPLFWTPLFLNSILYCLVLYCSLIVHVGYSHQLDTGGQCPWKNTGPAVRYTWLYYLQAMWGYWGKRDPVDPLLVVMWALWLDLGTHLIQNWLTREKHNNFIKFTCTWGSSQESEVQRNA